MRQTFSSEERTYDIDPTRLMDFLDELHTELRAEAERRKKPLPLNHLFLKGPDGGAYFILKQEGILPLACELPGAEFYIGVERSDPPVLVTDTLAEIVIAEDGNNVQLTIFGKEDLATSPEPVYRVAEKYSV